MKILYIITGLGQGGAERVVCDLADAMFEKGQQVKIAYLTGDIVTKPSHKDIELISIGPTRATSLPKVYIKLLKTIKKYQPDIVHTHMVHANILTRLVRLTTPMNKLISTAHNSNEGGTARMLAYRITDRLADLTTNVSNTAVTAFEEKRAVPKGNMLTVYNGVDFSNFGYQPEAKQTIANELGLPVSTNLLLAVGRFNAQKNYPNLLHAVKLLKPKLSTNFVLLIAGEGELRDEIEKLIKKLDIEDNVKLLGRRSDIPKLMSACDVFVLSSDYEGLPTVLIEALACQAQVVSTDVSGVNEIVGKHGYIVPVKDPVSLAVSIEESLKNPVRNIAGRNFVKDKFDLDTISDKWLKIYNGK